MGFFSKLFGNRTSDGLIICSPTSGEVVSTSQVKDETFSQDMIGHGFAVIPADGLFTSPIDGEVILVAKTGHAFSVRAKNGIEILVHIGLDTVNLNANVTEGAQLKAFKLLAKQGNAVKVGTPIIRVDLEAIKTAGFDTITPVIVVNNEVSATKKIESLTSGKVERGAQIIQVVNDK